MRKRKVGSLGEKGDFWWRVVPFWSYFVTKSFILVTKLQWSRGEILIPVAEISVGNRASQSYHINMTILFFQEFAGRQRSREPEEPD